MRIYETLQGLMRLEGEEFVAEAYRQLLDREADPVGMEHHLNLLCGGATKANIIIGLMLGAEAAVYYSQR
ncbi:DUF4214 domain-containing protein [Paenibacillus flagellatus]|nr:DUF4214 domain-containing protein [Paenibacillus flagellatus]